MTSAECKKVLGLSPVLKVLIFGIGFLGTWTLLVLSIKGIPFGLWLAFFILLSIFSVYAGGICLGMLLKQWSYMKTIRAAVKHNLSPQWGVNGIGSMLVDGEQKVIVINGVMLSFDNIQRINTLNGLTFGLEILGRNGEYSQVRSFSKSKIMSAFARLESALGW